MTFFKKIFPEKTLPYIVGGIAIVAFVFIFFGIEKVDAAREHEHARGSMWPTLSFGDRYVVLKHKTPRRYDIMVLRDARNTNRLIIKRVVGLPGETVALRHGVVLINGIVLSEPYIKGVFQRGVENYALRGLVSEIALPADFYYVMGDNRDESYDSRNFGPVHKKQIQGKIIAVIWPLKNRKIFWSY